MYYNKGMTSSWQVVGHSTVVDRLSRAVTDRAPAHAYLFAGPPHVGKMTVAALFAQALLCEQANGPCGTCAHCLLWQAGNHPDYLVLPRTETLTIAQVRDLRHQLRLRPHSAKWRVGIIPDAQRLGIPAQNALLKLLEEPPASTVLILTAPSGDALLSTTTSRCQIITFHLPAADELRVALKDQGNEAEQAILASGRRPGLALRLLEDKQGLADRQDWERQLMALVDAGTVARLKMAHDLAADEQLPAILDYWLALHREALQAELLPAETALSKGAEHLARHYALSQLRRNATRLFEAKDRLRYNPNVLLLVENLLVQFGE